jgi:hypothetical protein
MRGFSARFDAVSVPADTHSLHLMAANTPQAFDWPADVDVVRFTGATTGSSATTNAFAFAVNLVSTYAVWGSTFAISTASSGQNALVDGPAGRAFAITGGSTGYSVASGAAGLIGVEFWKRGG